MFISAESFVLVLRLCSGREARAACQGLWALNNPEKHGTGEETSAMEDTSPLRSIINHIFLCTMGCYFFIFTQVLHTHFHSCHRANTRPHGYASTRNITKAWEPSHALYHWVCTHVCTLNTAHHLRMYSEFSTPCSILTQDQTWVGHGHPRPHRYATSPSVLFAKFNCCGFRGKQKKLDMNPHIWNVTANVLTPMSYSRHLLSVKAPKGRNGNPIKDVWDM